MEKKELERKVEYFGKITGNLGTNQSIGPFDNPEEIRDSVGQKPFEFLTIEIYKIIKDPQGREVDRKLYSHYSIYPVGPIVG